MSEKMQARGPANPGNSGFEEEILLDKSFPEGQVEEKKMRESLKGVTRPVGGEAVGADLGYLHIMQPTPMRFRGCTCASVHMHARIISHDTFRRSIYKCSVSN